MNEKQADEERSCIFNCYNLGGERNKVQNHQVPQVKICPVVDKYGFIHSENDIKKPNNSTVSAGEKIFNRAQLECEHRWNKTLHRWQRNKQNIKELTELIYKGIPNTYRGIVWQKFLNIDKIIQNGRGTYESCLETARNYGTATKQIDLDVIRQFRNHVMFHERYSIKQVSLFKVLVTYSMYNKEVGYFREMAGLVAILLMYMNEEEAFWGLNAILTNQKYGMQGFYGRGYAKLVKYSKHHDTVIEKFLPKLKRHLDIIGVDSIIYCQHWFTVAFVEQIPFNLFLQIWDIFLYEGENILLAMSYTILKMHQHKLLKLKDVGSISTYLHQTIRYDFGYENDHVIQVLRKCIYDLKCSKLDLPLSSNGNQVSGIKNKFGFLWNHLWRVFRKPSNNTNNDDDLNMRIN